MSKLSTIGAVQNGPASSDALVRRLIADELDRIRIVLEDLGMQLCADSSIVRSHFNVLQGIDELCQRNENLARTLRAGDMVAETARITLDSLRARLQIAMLDDQAGSAADEASGTAELRARG
jgi:hypothetical protein